MPRSREQEYKFGDWETEAREWAEKLVPSLAATLEASILRNLLTLVQDTLKEAEWYSAGEDFVLDNFNYDTPLMTIQFSPADFRAGFLFHYEEYNSEPSLTQQEMDSVKDSYRVNFLPWRDAVDEIGKYYERLMSLPVVEKGEK